MINELDYYYKKRPVSGVQDFIKYLYQKRFGPAHFINVDYDVIHDFFMKEIQNLNPVAYHEDLYDYAGDVFARVNLRPYQALGFDLRALFERFIASSEAQANHEIFYADLNILYSYLLGKKFAKEQIDEKYSLAKKPGFMSFHHSEQYRNAYLPAYRLIKREFISKDIRYAQFINYLSSFSPEKPAIIAVEGRNENMITEFCAKAAEDLPITVISCDHFRDVDNENEFGINSERLKAEALSKLKPGKNLLYRKYNRRNREYSQVKIEKTKQLVLVEGIFSANPKLAGRYDAVIYIDDGKGFREQKSMISPDEREYRELWLSRLDKYYRKYNIMFGSDLIV